MRQVFGLELSPWLTTPNEGHEGEGDASVHVTPTARFIKVAWPSRVRSMTLKYPQLQQIRSDNLKFVYIHMISAAFTSRSPRVRLIYKV